ncbi:hypothetical protein F4808DRAFT_456990 [Astrocystis sublimbata]|nr:hypothetical protein F4808DRAFT_456990 [Astrocystis sublimbata]
MEGRSQLRLGSSRTFGGHHHCNVVPETDSSDDDYIPSRLPKRTSASPSKRLGYAPVPSDANNIKRAPPATTQGGIVLFSGSKKPRNAYNTTTMSPSKSPQPATGTRKTPIHKSQLSTSSEDSVVDGLISSVNGVLHHRQSRECHDQGLPQAVCTSVVSYNSNPQFNHLNSSSEDVQPGPDAASNEKSQTETELLETQADTISFLEMDSVWEVPDSPAKPNIPNIPEYISGMTQLQPLKKRRGRPPKNPSRSGMVELLPNHKPGNANREQGVPRKHYTLLCDGQDKDYMTRGAEIELEIKSSDDESVQLGQSTDGLQNEDFADDEHLAPDELVESNGNRSFDSATLSDSLSEFDTDLGSDDGVGGYSFQHDEDVFNARQKLVDVESDEAFKGPSDDYLSIRLDHRPLQQLCKLLGNKHWAGVAGGWQWRHFDYVGVESTPARALLPMLAKLERLLQATPKAPDLEAQNRFLREHANMLNHYLHKIKIVVEHIRTGLETPERDEANHQAGSRKRKRMLRDLIKYVIPMLTHVLASAWGLGGHSWLKASFTSAAIELLERVLGWIMRLHLRLLRELDRCCPEGELQSHGLKQAWRERKVKREVLAPLVDDVFRIIAAAPDQLAEVEARVQKELQQRQLQVEQERLQEIERKATEKLRQAEVAERKKRSLLSIHGITYRLGTEAPTPRTTTTSYKTSPSPELGSIEWSLEEQELLFRRIQTSFPICPDLNALSRELNKPAAQTVLMTEQILRRMLTKVLIGYSAEALDLELHQIMRSSGIAGL